MNKVKQLSRNADALLNFSLRLFELNYFFLKLSIYYFFKAYAPEYF